MKPGGWLDALFFAGGSIATVSGALWWSAREAQSSSAQMHLKEGVAIAGVVLLFGAGVYQAAQRSRVSAELLYPRRAGAAISVALGVAFPVLLVAGGQALDPVVGGLGSLALVCVLPWLLSRAQWTTTPPASE